LTESLDGWGDFSVLAVSTWFYASSLRAWYMVLCILIEGMVETCWSADVGTQLQYKHLGMCQELPVLRPEARTCIVDCRTLWSCQ
jgi:hypothetical protein